MEGSEPSVGTNRKAIGYVLVAAGVAAAVLLPEFGIAAAALLVVGLLLAFS